jgi:chain length determinant protein tyrosine kinase EpsG
MARFRDSRLSIVDQPPLEGAMPPATVHDRLIGEILAQTRGLTQQQIDQALSYSREKDIRFGEAAIALGMVSEEDVLYALSQQFHYYYAPAEQRHFSDELVLAYSPFSRQAEAFRAIRSQLMLRVFNQETARPALAVLSPESGDGKSYFAANIAVALSQLGGRTLLLDADLRGPRQHQILGLQNASGLSGMLTGRAEANVIQQVPALPNLYALTAGPIPPNPLELVERPAFGLLIRELRSKFDHVVVDTPAASFGADAPAIAARCGSALVVARKGASEVRSLQDLVNGLSIGPTQLVGVILNDH